MRGTSDQLIAAAKRLRSETERLKFSAPVTHVYHPLDYAWRPHAAYLRTYGSSRKKVVFLGMNPGPYGMVQTGVPFGEIKAVRDWMNIEAAVGKPLHEHPKRPVEGFACPRSEVSGQRLWGFFARRFPRAEDFFAVFFVANYCPLVFLEESGRNRTPDKLPASETATLFTACDRHLCAVVEILRPEWLIGVGDFAAKQAWRVFPNRSLKIGKVLHPSPASPAANRNWDEQAAAQLRKLGLWDG